VLLDFGLAKGDRVGPALTEPLVFLGTPRYSSPEAATGLTGPEGDVYSLALVVLEGLTGFRPADGAAHVLDMREQGTHYDVLAQIDAHALADDTRAVLARALSSEPASRPTAAELATELCALAARRASPTAVVVSLRPPRPKPILPRLVARSRGRGALALLLGAGLGAASAAWLVSQRAVTPSGATHTEPQRGSEVARSGSDSARDAVAPIEGARSAAMLRCADDRMSAVSKWRGATDAEAEDDFAPSGVLASTSDEVTSPALAEAAPPSAAAAAHLPECASLDLDCAPACEQYEAQLERGLPTTAVEACALKAYCNALAQCEPSKAFGLQCERAAAEQCAALRAPTRQFPG
jgi:hypothetical protein